MPTNLKEGQQVGKDGKIFDVFRGGSWKVQNMEKMTTEEYYAALNEKMKEVQAKRRAEGFGKEDSEKYRKSLNRAPNSQ